MAALKLMLYIRMKAGEVKKGYMKSIGSRLKVWKKVKRENLWIKK